jgi:hypothetical protein
MLSSTEMLVLSGLNRNRLQSTRRPSLLGMVAATEMKRRRGANPEQIVLTIQQLRAFRDEVLVNIRKHCLELYKRGMDAEACRTAAAIAAAEIADVLKERFGINI